MSPSQTEHPVLDPNGTGLAICREFLNERPERLGPVVGQLLHERDAVGVQSWDCDSLAVGPGDDDLAMVCIFAAFVEVARRIENCVLHQ